MRQEVADALVAVLGPQARALIAVRPSKPREVTPLYLARQELGESGREVARRIGVSKDVYYRAERGQSVHEANAKLIADAFGLTVSDVLGIERQAA